MAAALEEKLVELNSYFAKEDAILNAQKSHDIVGDVGHICLQDTSEKDIDYCCSVLFNKDNGILTFLHKTATIDEYQSSKAEILEFLLAFLQRHPGKCLPYAPDIKDICVSLFMRERFAKVKQNCIPVVIELLKQVSGSKVSNDMNIDKLRDKFFLDLIQGSSKLTATVKHQLFHVLGVLAEVHCEKMISHSDRLLDLYVKALKTEMMSKTKKPEFMIIAGCFQGLSHLLVNFTQSAEEGAKHSYDIYKYTKMAIDPEVPMSRYQMVLAALTLMERHAPQFNLYLIDEYETMYDRLTFWSCHHNRDVMNHGKKALESFLKQISEMLVLQAEEGQMKASTFKFFVQKFRKVMDDPKADYKQVNLAIRGYGYFAAPCRIYMSESDVKFMFTEMMQRSEQIYLTDSDQVDDKLINLPSFLDALGSIVRELKQISDAFLTSLERLVVLLMESFPKLGTKMHYTCFLTLLRILFALAPKGALFKGFLSRLVYQGLIRTCSHPILIDTENQGDDVVADVEDVLSQGQKPKISYRDYLPMWYIMLESRSVKELTGYGIDVNQRQALGEAVYDQLIESLLKMVDKLDLTSSKASDLGDDQDLPSTSDGSADLEVTSDPIQGLQPSKPKDFIIFINMVEFAKELLPDRCIHLFRRWILKFGHDVILHSTKLPLVSGFYKLLAVCMEVARKLRYFKGMETYYSNTPQFNVVNIKKEELKVKQEPDSQDHVMEESGDLAQREASFLLFSKFTKEVLVRMKQYKDDLLGSCLSFILSLPREIVIAEIKSIVPALKTTLEMGRSYLPLAVAGLNALEHWSLVLPPHVIEPYYAVILPCLDPYLRSSTDAGEADQTVSITQSSAGKRKGKKKIPVKLLKNKVEANKTTETQLNVVRRQCVYLLGSLGGSINRLLVQGNAEEISKTAVAWDTKKHLKFDIPFMDIKPTIYFDAFLPRIVELATTSSDRQTKVAACELLHSLMLFMIGRNATQPGASREEKYSMEELFRRLFPAMLKLACDVELVTKQLFEPLMMQLIHWLTGGKRYESVDTMVLLDTILDGLVNPTDSTVRDFSATCVKEFLIWSVKQTSKKEMEKRPFNVVSLLHRIYSLAKHPSAFKRLGAALAFNNIYMVFREEESLVDQFTFEILCEFIQSLALAHNDEKSLGTAEQCKQVLNHLERILKTKAKLLTETTKKRVCPRGWASGTLLNAIKWLLRQCGRPQTECRHACMQLAFKIMPLFPGVDAPADMFESLHEQNGPQYFIQRFEGALYKTTSGKHGILRKRHLGDMDDTFSLKTTLNWFDMILAALDCYCWVFSEGLLPASILVSGNKGTSVFEVLTHFLSDLAQSDLAAAAEQFKNHPNMEIFTPHEQDEYNKMKCTVIVRTLNFICVCFGKHKNESLKVFPSSFWSDSLWGVVLNCVLNPSALGFNMGDVEVIDNLPNETLQTLQVLSRCLPVNILKGFKTCLVKELKSSGPCNLKMKLPLSLQDSGNDPIKLIQVVSGYEQLQNTGLLKDGLSGTDCNKLATELLHSATNGLAVLEDKRLVSVSLSPAAHSLGTKLLSLAFAIGIPLSKLLDVIMDQSEVYNASGNSSHLGTLFYVTFKNSVNSHLVTEAKQFIPLLLKFAAKECGIVGNVLAGMIDYISKDRTLRKRLGSKIVELILSSWPLLQCWWDPGKSATQETKTIILDLLTKLIIVDAKVVTDAKSAAFGDVFQVYLAMLVDNKTSLAFKSRVLDLLLFFANLPEEHNKKLKSKLDRFVADNFPSRSDEYPEGGTKYNDYITALNKLLSALEISGSVTILEVLISIVCREDRHVHEEHIQNSITRFVKRLPMDKQKPAADVAFNIFTSTSRFNNQQKRAALERVCLSMLRDMKMASLIEFFTDHIKEIMNILEAKDAKGSEAAMETQIVTKLCCYELVEVMFVRLSRDDVCSKNSRINSVYCNNKAETGKEMAQTITKMAHQCKQEDMRGETTLMELRRQYHCAAYNTAIAVISCVQTDLKFYQGFLFAENPTKGQFLWENLVDEKKAYEFVAEMETPLARRKKFVAIRNEARDQRRRLAEDEGVHEAYTRSVHYLASQYLADSSLSTDVNQYDFSSTAHASVLSSSSSSLSSGAESRESRLSNRDSIAEEPVVTVTDEYVEMEMDALNQHECMASLTALLQHMSRNNITPTVAKGSQPTELPRWMIGIRDKLQDSRVNGNIKLFLCKLIVNAEEVFRPYAKFWLSPLVHLLTSGVIGGEGINYFVTDLVVTILSWHTVAIPEDNSVDRSMASRLTEYLCKYCHHDNRSVLRNNLEVLKTLVEVWKSRIDVPTKVLYENFTAEKDQKSRRNATGIQMVGVMLANKLTPWRTGCGVDKDKFYRYIAMNMLNGSKPVYSATAEVVGMIIKFLEETEKGSEADKWRSTFMDNIAKMLMPVQAKTPDQFVITVYKMQLHYPVLADRFMSKILFMLPKVHGEFRTFCLSIIQQRAEHINSIFLEMKQKGINDILTHRDEESQLVALKLVQNILKILKPDELLYLMPAVTSFSQSPYAECRAVMFDVLMWVYDNYSEGFMEEDSQCVDKIMTLTKDTLLQGLSDDHLKNRLTIQNFWSHETRLPGETLDRMVAMLEAMYSPCTESQYLSYATNLLLEMTSKSPDFNREIFERPLSECKFEEYNIRSSWRQRHATMAPLFATQASQSQSSPDESMDTSMITGDIRATQEVQQFTPTQADGSSRAPYNWLTQSSLDTYAADYSLTQNTETQSSLLFTIGKSSGKPTTGRVGKAVGPGFGKGRLGKDTVDGDAGAEQRSEILRLKKRFMKDRASSQAFFAKREAKKKILRQQLQEEQKKRRENQVTMYRKYRMGDLPDIQIKYSYLIAPLQALAQRDSAIARMLFSSVFRAIFSKIETVKTERECREITDKISQSLNSVLSNSTQYFPPFIGCIMDIAQECPRKLKLGADIVNTACSTSLQQPLGIVLLEEMLIQTGDTNADTQPSKRRRGDAGTSIATTSVSMDTDCWVELARLYKSIGDYDVLRGIFSSKFGTQDLTSKALELEIKGDYQAALKLYKEGLTKDWGSDSPNEVEMDLWEDSRLQCMDYLSKWDDLETVSMDTADDSNLEKIWDDTYYMEHYFPYMVRGRLKLLLSGDEEQDSLLNFIDKALKVPDRKALLENKYSEELALMYVWQEDYDRAKYYTNTTLQRFLQDWSGLDTLMTTSRVAKIQTLQKLTELNEFTEFMSKESNFTDQSAANKLIDRWTQRAPDIVMDTTQIWDDVITNRCVYIDHMVSKLSLEEEDSEMFERKKLLLRLDQANSAREQDNFVVALLHMRNTRIDIKQLKDPVLNLRWTHNYATIHQRRCQVTDMELDDKLTALTGVISTLEKEGQNNKKLFSSDLHLYKQQELLQGQTLYVMTVLLQQNRDEFGQLEDDVKETVGKVAGCTKKSLDEIISSLIERGYQFMKTSVSLATRTEDVTPYADTRGVTEAYMSLVKYCDRFLRDKEDQEDGNTIDCPSMSSFPEAMVTSLLRAMKINSTEARQLFPRLLQIVEYYPDTMATFIKLSSEVPCWMYLGWLGQMTALLDKPESPAIQDILLTIGQTYPSALVYPFKMSLEGYKFDNNAIGKKAADVCTRLVQLVNRNKLVDLFIQALEQMGQPNAIFKDFIDDFKLRKLMESPKKHAAEIKEIYLEMYRDLMADQGSLDDEDLYSTQSSLPDNISRGEYREKFASKFRPALDKLCGKDGSKILSMSYQDFAKNASKIRQDMDALVGTPGGAPPVLLAKYSTFLAEFQASEHLEKQLEIPGQYTGEQKPLPEYHTKVSSFGEQVRVMKSLRKPKTITIRGNDQRDYKYLVKGGEDLRQDQRVEQLFDLMNRIFDHDPMCRQRKLKLRTYQVIPITPRVGLIEWVENTSVFKDVLYDQLTTAEAKMCQKAQTDHNTMIGGTNPKFYHEAYRKFSKTETSAKYRQRCNMVPRDLLRRAYLDMAASSEAFFTLKSNLATSHAQLCICQWILGIGDRHLSNFMIDRETGKMIGIDFGHAFGSATQFLPIPELMPFRLTRQLRNLMMPLREKGLVEGTMIHTLRALRKNSDLLLSTMDIFIKEPSLDWEQNAYREIKALSSKDGDVTDLSENLEWYPKEKVSYARKKLEGYNPMYITREELALNATLRDSIRKDYVGVLLGDKSNDLRARSPKKGLSVEQQVGCLLNQATDPNILGRVWVGWESWM